MNRFVQAYTEIDRTNANNGKIDAIARYVADSPPADAAWGIWFLLGDRPKRLVPARRLSEWVAEETGIYGDLLEASYAEVGDSAELIALLVDAHRENTPPPPDISLDILMKTVILPLGTQDEAAQRDVILAWWRKLPVDHLFLFIKLLTGEFRVGVSKGLVIKALAKASALAEPVIAHRLMGNTAPTAEWLGSVLDPETSTTVDLRPYPFFLASPIEKDPATLGERADWLAEWKWDGIRCQIVKRAGEIQLWSRGEELVTDRFPEIVSAAATLPEGTVLDGEAMAWQNGAPLPFAVLQTRIGRKKLTKKNFDEAPVSFVGYDLLEEAGVDRREEPLSERRRRLETLLEGRHERLVVSPRVEAPSWEALAELRAGSRERHVEGLMLKKWNSTYQAGRRRGDWWKWKIDPWVIDAVLTYAQPGHGRRASLYTDYTFGVWRGDELVTVAKAYSGLTQEEIEELDKWIRQHTVERFGPVRQVEPVHVFELAFEGVQRSTRHKAGIAVRFPRISRWRKDKPVAEADTLDALFQLADSDASPSEEP